MAEQPDPELRRRIEAARTSGETVHAVVGLQRVAGEAPVPADIEQQARQALDRTADLLGEQAQDVHVMGRMAVAYVAASARFVEALVEQPEVSGAVANQAPEG